MRKRERKEKESEKSIKKSNFMSVIDGLNCLVGNISNTHQQKESKVKNCRFNTCSKIALNLI